MTTEIAVINKLGVALATDSAVTISGEQQKVFDTGDKLFELCDHAPVGVMVNGNMDMLGVPWEIIIKDFRSQASDTNISVKQWLDRLIDFAAAHKAHDAHHADRYIQALAQVQFEQIKRMAGRRMFEGDEMPTPDDGVVQGWIVQEAGALAAVYDASEPAESLKGMKATAILKAHKECIDMMINHAFQPVVIQDETRTVLHNLMVSALLSSEPSSYATGIIVAGYGENDMFPSLAMAEVDGVVNGRVKYSHREDVRINRSTNPGRVISFAQADVVERLLSGADHNFIEKSSDFIEESMGALRNELGSALAELGADPESAAAMLADVTSAIVSGYRDDFVGEAQREFEGNFNRTVALMPKRDVIELAEALVSITAIERKASLDVATVGGPVDVAFITRHEGFVWIKRKHYFEPDLNPRYFWRRFRLALEGESPCLPDIERTSGVPKRKARRTMPNSKEDSRGR